MIVAVEGPSAAGKTTWCRRHAQRFIREYESTGDEPGDTDPTAQASYWVQINSDRWSASVRLEAEDGLAVCDGDPLKLHYSWCLAMVGAASRDRFDRELKLAREAFKAGRLGLADIVLVGVPSLEDLHARRDAHSTRRRHNFELHARLREPLVRWYQAVDDLDPGRVLWELPPRGLLALPRHPPRPNPSDVDLLDALVADLQTP